MERVEEVKKFVSIIKNMNEVQQMGVLMMMEGMKAIKNGESIAAFVLNFFDRFA